MRETHMVEAVSAALNENRGRIERSLAGAWPIKKYLQLTANVIRSSPALEKCSPASIITSVLQAAEVRLCPGNVLGHAYLVPYKGKCTFIIGYKGILQLCSRSPEILHLQANTVHEGDVFDYTMGANATLEHRPVTFGSRTVSNCEGAYALAKLRNGEVVFEVMSKAELEAVRSRAQSKAGPWSTDTLAMYRKTTVRKIAAWLPLGADGQQAIAEDEARDYGVAGPRDVDATSVADILNQPDQRPDPATMIMSPPTLSDKQAMAIEEWLASEEVDQMAVQGFVSDTLGKPGISSITEADADSLIEALELGEFSMNNDTGE